MARISLIICDLCKKQMEESHEEYSVASEPDDFEDLLLRRVELRCATTSREARRKLLDDKVYWTEY